MISKTKENEKIMEKQLKYLYNQIIFFTTTQINKLHEKRPHFDLKKYTEGTEKYLDSILNFSLKIFLDSFFCLFLDDHFKSLISRFFLSFHFPFPLIFALVLTEDYFVNLSHSKSVSPIHPKGIYFILP